jgi:hypothetical protein
VAEEAQMTRYRWPLAVAVALAGLVSACSGSAPTGGTGAGATTPPVAAQTGGAGGTGAGAAAVGDPCSLLTPAQVSAIIGLTVGPGDSGGDTHSCDWSHLDQNGVPDTQVLVDTNVDQGLCAGPSSSALGITVTPVPGVGDLACMTQAAGLSAGDDLTFYKGGLGFSVGASGKGVTPTNEVAVDKALALDVLANR